MKSTGRFDYYKTVAKEEFFFANLIIIVCSVLAIICGLFLIIYGANNLFYTVMFGCASMVMGMNALKGQMRKNGYGQVFSIISILLLVIAGYFLYMIISVG